MFGVYIHVPWCVRRCLYCDFYFEIGKNTAGFTEAIQIELANRRHLWPETPLNSLYFGGGTPSLLAPDQIVRLVHFFSFTHQAEITLEMNPEHASAAYLQGIFSSGINRLSLGIQSFDDRILRQLGRKHRADAAKQAIMAARQAGFDRLSVDLIIGVPNEDATAFKQHVDMIAELGVGHVSIYSLTVEPQTPLNKLIEKGRAVAPDDDTQAEAYENAQQVLSERGFKQYEVASFAQPGHEGVHNRIYWSKGSYLGLGPGAHSMLLQSNGSVYRRHTVAPLAEWMKSPASANFSEETLTPEHAFREAVAFGLRDMGLGIDIKKLAQRHRCDVPADFNETVKNFESLGWLVVDGAKWCMTPLGARFADAIAREFLA